MSWNLLLSEYLQLLSRGGWGIGFSGFGDLLYPSIHGKWRKPSNSGLWICWTFFQLLMQIFLLEDHKLLFAQRSPWAGSFIPPPSSSATLAFSSCCHSLGEDSSTESPLPLCLHNISLTDITVVEVLLSLTIKPCKHPPSNRQAGSATDGLLQTLTE